MSTSPVNLSADATTLDAAVRNQLAASTAMAASLNANLLANYNYAVDQYNQNMASGQQVPPERQHAPVPAMAYELSKADAAGFQYPIQGTTPIAPQAPDAFYHGAPQVAKPANVIHVGHAISGRWFTAGPGDTFANGMTTPPVTSDDGVTGIFEKFGAPVGNGWYLQQS